MARSYQKNKRTNSVYKLGKLTRGREKFNTRGVDKKWLVIGICLLASFLFAVILGNILGDKAASSQNSSGGIWGNGSIFVPSADKTSPKLKLHAYFADISNVDPNTDISLSVHTGTPRQRGNSLCIDIRKSNGTLNFTSENAEALGFNCTPDLKLSRLNNHFDYYNDYVVGIFRSEFSAALSDEERLDLIKKEALLLKEATKSAFEQIIIEFSGSITKQNAIYFEAYLFEIKLVCGGTPIGIKMDLSTITDDSTRDTVSSILSVADFYAVDLGQRTGDDLAAALDSLSRFGKRYNSVILLSEAPDQQTSERISLLEEHDFDSYIIK